MEQSERDAGGPPRLGAIRRKSVRLAEQKWVEERFLHAEGAGPLLIQPSIDGVDLTRWVMEHRATVEARLLKYGGILFRGFNVDSVARFEQFVASFDLPLLDYQDQHTPRTKLTASVYTSTEYPADHQVPFHSENSKNLVWPMKLWFCCLQSAQQGGETPIADNRLVFNFIPREIRERFAEKKVMYVRNFGEGVGLPWQTALQTSDPAEAERYCRQSHMEFEWKSESRLKVRQICQAVTVHPKTSENLWFNQAHLFHVSNLPRPVRESLPSLFKEEDLPSNAYYGDGSAIEDDVLDEIRSAFRRASVTFQWQKGDLLMLDNMLVAHSRNPYVGTRKILVAMADAFSWEVEL
jgi:alpha-ketoglutarate-dependent taurine dioxygenase